MPDYILSFLCTRCYHAEISVDAGDLRGEVQKFVEVYIFRLKSQRLQGQHENGVMFPDMGILVIFDIHIVDSNMSVIKIIGVLPLHITASLKSRHNWLS